MKFYYLSSEPLGISRRYEIYHGRPEVADIMVTRSTFVLTFVSLALAIVSVAGMVIPPVAGWVFLALSITLALILTAWCAIDGWRLTHWVNREADPEEIYRRLNIPL